MKSDQTQFSAEEPLYEEVSLPVDPTTLEVKAEDRAKVKKRKVLQISIVMAVVALVLVVLVASIFIVPTANIETETPLPSSEPVQLDPLQARIKALQKQVRQADPSLDAYPLPPVDLKLGLGEDSSSN